MRRDEEKIKQSLNNFLDSLVVIAEQDNVITDDERQLLQLIEKEIKNMEKQLMQILEDDLPDDEYQDLVNQIMQDIVFNATKLAKEDGIVTKDESALLDQLEKFAEEGVVLNNE